jgi:hypothetical protein
MLLFNNWFVESRVGYESILSNGFACSADFFGCAGARRAKEG